MTNNYSTVKNNLASNKKLFIRMFPGRSIIDDLVLSYSTVYTMTFPFATISDIKVNGNSYYRVQKVSSTGEWSYDESNGLLTIGLTASKSTFDNIVAYYYIFYTNFKSHYHYEDPGTQIGLMRFWDARIDSSPTFEVTSKDIIDGFLTVGNTNFSIHNHDNDFQKYLTSKDSFSKKEVVMWHSLDGNDNVNKFYSGFINSLSISSNSVSFSIDNPFNKFQNILYSGTSFEQSTYNTTKFPNLSSKDLFRPITKHYSSKSRTVHQLFQDSSYTAGLYPKFSEGFEAVNINFSNDRLNNTNRQWGCFLKNSNIGIHSETAGAVTNPVSFYYVINVSDGYKYEVGDNIQINNTGSYAPVIATYPTQIVTFKSTTPTPTTGCIVTRPEISMVQIFDDNNVGYPLEYGLHYYDTTFDTNVRGIIFYDNFESTLSGAVFSGGAISPTSRIIYRAYNIDPLDHGTVLQAILDKSGVGTYTPSFTSANSTTIKTNFSIPFYGNSDFGSIQEYAQAVLASTFGYLYINSELNVGYSLINSISPTNDITENEIIENTLSQAIDYKDVYSSVEFINRHGTKVYQAGGLYGASATRDSENLEIVSNREAYFLHEIDRKKKIEVVVESIANVKNRIKELLGAHRYTIDLTTKGINFDSVIGDTYNIKSDKILGTNNETKGIILGITKSNNQTNVTFVNLEML
ncbi:MAG: hypothetical protein ACP5N7_01115 [Candidatus Pacearchaeota archaeon]